MMVHNRIRQHNHVSREGTRQIQQQMSSLCGFLQPSPGDVCLSGSSLKYKFITEATVRPERLNLAPG